MRLPVPPRSAHYTAGRGASMLAVFQHLFAIDKHVHHAGGVLVWLDKRSVILNRFGIEDKDVSLVAFLEPAAPVDNNSS